MIGERDIAPDDWAVWRDLRRQALAEAPAAFGSTLSDWSGAGDTEARWRERLRSAALNVILTLDNRPAGMVSATAPGHDDTIELISMWIAPFARGKGVGDAAIERVLRWAAHEHPFAKLQLSVKTLNEPAIRLYRRHGFADAGTSPDDPSERLMRL